PAAGGRVVDGASHERVAEAEPPRDVRVANQIELQEFVDCVHRRTLRRRSGGRRQLGLEWVACNSCSFENKACALGQQAQLLAQRGGDGGRDVDPRQRELGRGDGRTVAAERPRQLLEIERVSTALVIEYGRIGNLDLLTEKLSSLERRQSGELNALQRCRAMSPFKPDGTTLRHLLRSDRH